MRTDALTNATVRGAIAVERVSHDGLEVVGAFHSDQWGDFKTYFRFRLAPSGKIARLDVGQVE